MPTYTETSDGSCCCGGCACPAADIDLFATFDCPGFPCVDGVSFTLAYVGLIDDPTSLPTVRPIKRWTSSAPNPCDCDGPIVIDCDPSGENPTFLGYCFRLGLCAAVTSYADATASSPLEVTFAFGDTGFFGPCSLTVTE